MSKTIRIAAIATAMALTLGVGAAVAQQGEGKSCVHEGRVYPPGATLEMEGGMMQCDGETGTWVPVSE